jgi:hypothetical protein
LWLVVICSACAFSSGCLHIPRGFNLTSHADHRSSKVTSYDDIIEAQRKRDIKEATTAGATTPGRKRQNTTTGGNKRARVDEVEHGRHEIEALGLEGILFGVAVFKFMRREFEPVKQIIRSTLTLKRFNALSYS